MRTEKGSVCLDAHEVLQSNRGRNLEIRLLCRRTNSYNSLPSDDAVSPSGQHSGSSRRSSFITPKEYTERDYSLSPLVIAWSPTCYVNDRGLVLCAVGTKAGSVWLLRVALPEYYSVEKSVPPKMSLLGEIFAHKSWLTTFSWGTRSCIKDTTEDTVVLATGSSDGRYAHHLLFSIITIKIINTYFSSSLNSLLLLLLLLLLFLLLSSF